MTCDLQKAAAECRLEAAECQRHAKKAWLPSNRRYYLEIADNFLRLAEGYERDRDLKQNIDRLKELRAEHDEGATAERKDKAA
jgi:hypothetical protein